MVVEIDSPILTCIFQTIRQESFVPWHVCESNGLVQHDETGRIAKL